MHVSHNQRSAMRLLVVMLGVLLNPMSLKMSIIGALLTTLTNCYAMDQTSPRTANPELVEGRNDTNHAIWPSPSLGVAGAPEEQRRMDEVKRPDCPSSLRALCIETYKSHFATSIFPEKVALLAQSIDTQFPKGCSTISSQVALKTLLRITQVCYEDETLRITPVSIDLKNHIDITDEFSGFFNSGFTSRIVPLLREKSCGCLNACLDEIITDVYLNTKRTKLAALEESCPLLATYIKTEVKNFEKPLHTKCQLPARQELRKQLADFDDVLNHCDLLERLAGKDFPTLVIGAQFQMALGDYRTYLQENKNYTEDESIEEGARIQNELLPLIFKGYPREYKTLQKVMAKETEIMVAQRATSGRLHMATEETLSTRLQEPPLDHLKARTSVIARFAGESFTGDEFCQEVNAAIDEYKSFLIQGGQKPWQADVISQTAKKFLYRALMQDYPAILKKLEELGTEK